MGSASAGERHPSTPRLSVVVPALDEAANLGTLVTEVREALDPAGITWELIVVDDGSTDETAEVLAALAAAEPRLRHLRHERRAGQTAALVTGFAAARGELIGTLDADLQCRPTDLPRLVDALGDADLACGIRVGRRDPSSRRAASLVANGLRRLLLAPGLKDLACPARVFRASSFARLTAETPLFSGAHRWLPALFALAGMRITQVPVPHWPRRAGESKYTTRGRLLPITRESAIMLRLVLRRSWRLRAVLGAALLVLAALPFLYLLGRWPLLEPDEGRNAEVAREMLELGAWAVPHFNHLPYLDKPAMLFWLTGGSFAVLGVNEFAARLPAAASAVATIALTYGITRRLTDRSRALLAAAVMATAPLVLVFARLVIFDMPFTAFVTLALWCLVRARIDGGAAWLVPAAGIAMAAATLTKGPLGFALPVLAWLAGRGALAPPRERTSRASILLSVLLYATVVGTWVVVVLGREPDFLRYALVDETLLRFTSVARFHRGGAPYYYLVTLAWAFGPWCVVLLATSPELFRLRRLETRESQTARFAARAAVTMLVFFTLAASKRPQYILPALVPLAILCALGARRAPERAAGALGILGGVAVAAGLALALAAQQGFHLEGAGERSAASAPVLALAGVVIAVWGALTVAARRLGSWPVLACAALLTPALGLLLLRPLEPWANMRSARTLATLLPPGAKVVSFQAFHTSLPFYLRRPVPLLSGTAGELTSNYVCSQRARFGGDVNLVPPRALRTILASGEPVYVITRPSQLERIARLSDDTLRSVYADERSVLLQR
jgi:4-amino-4-deoxy-L-arabinose transferase-like glycosyltransferase/glycosyltransferase involved in cell wall biosynthesis